MNSFFLTPFPSDLFVLIDTWWNVNITFKAKYIAKVTVLIDTWWNVNSQNIYKN